MNHNIIPPHSVSASNKYGTSRPGPVSDVLRNVSPTQENGAESSGDEGGTSSGEIVVPYAHCGFSF